MFLELSNAIMEEEEKYNPYCELCTGCGEEGCCSHLICFSKAIKNEKCKYGETYLNEAILVNDTNKMIWNLIEKLEKDVSYTKQIFLKDVDDGYKKLLHKYFENEND